MQHPKRWAFLVGVNQYHDGYATLDHCVNDVKALERLLEAIGYIPVCLHDYLSTDSNRYPTKTNIEAELEALLAKVDKHDLLLVYFACHGVRHVDKTTEEHNPMLIVCDTRKLKLRTSAISVRDYLKPQIEKSQAQQKLLMLDACFIGAGRSDRDPVDYLSRVSALTKGFAVLSASTEKQEALESSALGHGIFCHFVLQGLAGEAARVCGQKVVMLSMLQAYVNAEIREYTTRYAHNVVQIPQGSYVGDAGDFILADYQNDSFLSLNNLLHAEAMPIDCLGLTGRGPSVITQVDNSPVFQVDNEPVASVIDSLWTLNYTQQCQQFQKDITDLTTGAVIAIQAETSSLQLWLAKRLLRRLPKPEIDIHKQCCTILAREAATNFDVVWEEVWKSLHRDSRHVAPYQDVQEILNKVVERYQTDANIIILVKNWKPKALNRGIESRLFLQKLIEDFWQPLRQTVANQGVQPLFGRLILCLMDVKGRNSNLTGLGTVFNPIGLIDLDPLNIPQGDLKAWVLRNPVIKAVDQSKVKQFLAEFGSPESLQDSEMVISEICYLCGLNEGIGDLLIKGNWDRAPWRLVR